MRSDDGRSLRVRYRRLDFRLGVRILWEDRLLTLSLPLLVVRIPLGVAPPGQPAVFRGTEPTQLFQRAFTTSGSLCQTLCEPCGRVHFVGRGVSTGDFEPGELDELERLAAERPDWYVEEREFDTIDVAVVSGRNVVTHCPCHYLRTYESFVRDNRFLLAKFLRLLAEKAEEDWWVERKLLDVPTDEKLAGGRDDDGLGPRGFGFPGETS